MRLSRDWGLRLGPPLFIASAACALQGLLTANQLASHCDAISKFTGQSFSKLYLVKGLQENAQ